MEMSETQGLLAASRQGTKLTHASYFAAFAYVEEISEGVKAPITRRSRAASNTGHCGADEWTDSRPNATSKQQWALFDVW
jgi:hypothetical protein